MKLFRSKYPEGDLTPDPQLVVEALNEIAEELSEQLRSQPHLAHSSVALRRALAALPHAEAIARLWPLYEAVAEAARRERGPHGGPGESGMSADNDWLHDIASLREALARLDRALAAVREDDVSGGGRE